MNNKIDFCKDLIYAMGRDEKINLIKKSNLNNRESLILFHRFVEGLSIKESASKVQMEEDAFNKAQKRALKKLYDWIDNIQLVNKITELLQI